MTTRDDARRADDRDASIPEPPEFAAIVAVAQAYCDTIEAACAEPPARDWLVGHVRRELADLLPAGLRLPDVDANNVAYEPESVSSDRWRRVFGALQAGLGDRDYYVTNLQVYGEEARDLGTGSLADDLADVWRDLREGLDALTTNARWDDVAWEWRFGLDVHWGKHAVEALRAIHEIRA
ncbi:MAG: hypothetical protein JWR52_3010 [Marmoricola sp.]|nr:hypothetical protein [Marmoricola sp.]